MPRLQDYMIGERHQNIIGNKSANVHYRTKADIIGSDPQCFGEGPNKNYYSLKHNFIDHTGHLVFKLR